MSISKKKMLYKHRAFGALLKSYNRNTKYEGNGNELTVATIRPITRSQENKFISAN
ncbi:hypothetical protein WH47_07566 [Habropoda laboriosa]|uniref:Uncharacterized protein n=1 Tax=Habropoda laboriosa TaxID=597456 RepID=A0A0L7RE75_9HYME|nr:hypothetical protein WH47_07566 [Habropoda laboriosa]